MTGLKRRVSALEKPTRFVTLGDLLDALDGTPLPAGAVVDPSLIAALDAIGDER